MAGSGRRTSHRGRAFLFGLFLVALAQSTTFAAAVKPQPPNTEAMLRSFKPGVTVRAQVEQSLGQPQKSESTPEGLVAYTYASAKNGSKAGDNVSGLATMAGMGSWLLPTQMGMVTMGMSAVAGAGGTAMKAGSKKGGGTGDVFYVVFDRDGRLARWKGEAGGRVVSSSDHGGIPLLPQQTIDQAVAMQQPSGDDPAMPATAAPPPSGVHLGLRILPIDLIAGEAARADLDAAGIVGFYVAYASPGEPGAVAGLEPNDLVYLIDGTLIATHTDLERTLARLHPGATVAVRFYRHDPATGHWNEQITQVKF